MGHTSFHWRRTSIQSRHTQSPNRCWRFASSYLKVVFDWRKKWKSTKSYSARKSIWQFLDTNILMSSVFIKLKVLPLCIEFFFCFNLFLCQISYLETKYLNYFVIRYSFFCLQMRRSLLSPFSPHRTARMIPPFTLSSLKRLIHYWPKSIMHNHIQFSKSNTMFADIFIFMINKWEYL